MPFVATRGRGAGGLVSPWEAGEFGSSPPPPWAWANLRWKKGLKNLKGETWLVRIWEHH